MAQGAYGVDQYEVAVYPSIDYGLQASLGDAKPKISGKKGLMQSERPIATYTSAANIKR
jgi:hypothetical protein